VLAAADEPTKAAFQALRRAAEASGPLDQATVELVLIGALCAVEAWESLETHLRRAAQLGVTPQATRQAVLATLAAATGLNSVVEGLRLVDKVAADVPAGAAPAGSPS
jgi:alkylhydroperoxidase/carboxymuconolactone decarboxylase family protein YurZ